jgi:hypothetical protein
MIASALEARAGQGPGEGAGAGPDAGPSYGAVVCSRDGWAAEVLGAPGTPALCRVLTGLRPRPERGWRGARAEADPRLDPLGGDLSGPCI